MAGVLCGGQGPVELDVQGGGLTAVQTDVMPHDLVEARSHVRGRLDVAQGLEASHSLGQAILGHQEVNIAHRPQADAGVEGQGEGSTLENNDGDLCWGAEGQGSRGAGERGCRGAEVQGRIDDRETG
jgi:hypothetical protein